MKHVLTALACLAALPAAAQSVGPCDATARADFIAEPWELNTKIFSNGKVRLAVLDTIEPAGGPVHLLILSPPYNEIGDRQCRVVSLNEGGMGFADMNLTEISAAYDPSVGLLFDIPIRTYDSTLHEPVPAWLGVTLNQATGQIDAFLQSAD